MHFRDTSEDIGKDEKINNRYVVKKILPYFKKEWRAFSTGITLLIFIICAELSLPMILKELIDKSLPTGDVKKLITLAGFYLGVFLFALTLGYFQYITLAKMGLRIVKSIKIDVFKHILQNDISFFDKNTPGILISRVESDSENIKQLFTNIILNIAKSVAHFFGIFAILLVTDPGITLYVGILIPICMLTTYLMIRYIKKFYSKNRKLYAEIVGLVTEYLQSIEIIQLHNYFKKATSKIKNANIKKYKNDKKMFLVEYSYWSFFLMFEIAAICIVLAIGGYKLSSGAMTIGTMIMFIEFIRKLFYPIMEFSEYLNMIQKAFVSAHRIFNLMDHKPAIFDPIKPAELSGFNTSLKFNDVSFSYEPDKPVLKNTSFTVNKGEVIAIVGASGAGKSTIVNLCMRFYDPDKGSITLDGTNINEFTQKDLRSRVGLVTQDLYIFPGSISDNIKALNPDITADDVKHSVETLGISPLIDMKINGIDTILSEKGQNLSHGERQLISFARALAKRPELLILDEATSSVDPATEKLIQTAISRMLTGQTAIVIAHRLSTIVNADKILVFEHGRLIEQGTHLELVDESRVYKKMFELQNI